MDWYKSSYRRNLMDMHIEDWDPNFLSKLTPEVYVEHMKKAHVKSSMVYANAHTGHCFWPATEGHMHACLNGEDFFGKTVELLHQESIDCIAYYSINFANDEYAQHPEWRCRDFKGKGSRDLGSAFAMGPRYGNLCLNNTEYREYAIRQMLDLLDRYPLEGIFIDMHFWPCMCFCESCRTRYKREQGRDLPETVDWNDENWRNYVKTREAWLNESAAHIYTALKSRHPNVTIEHNLASLISSWTMGQNDGLSNSVDFTSGDFYGNMAYQNFVCKLHHSMSSNLPFEFMNSKCYPDLSDHTSIKPLEVLKLENYLALSNGGAFFFIDAIDPDGTICSAAYERLGEVFRESEPFEKYLGGTMKADAAIYFSTNSKYNLNENGLTIEERFTTYREEGLSHMVFPIPTHTRASIQASRILQEAHIPFAVLTKKSLAALGQYQVLIISSVASLDDEEASLIKTWVSRGGKLYITSPAPLPLASELLGFEYQGTTSEHLTYVAPSADGAFAFADITNPTAPITYLGAQQKISTPKTAQVLANIVLPCTDPADPYHFASIHSNPPGKTTSFPAMILGKCGDGEVIWSSVPFESYAQEYPSHCKVFENVIRRLCYRPTAFCTNAPYCVDITRMEQDDRTLINVLNIQEHEQILPVYNFSISVNTYHRNVSRVTLLPDDVDILWTEENGIVSFHVDRLAIYKAFMIYYS